MEGRVFVDHWQPGWFGKMQVVGVRAEVEAKCVFCRKCAEYRLLPAYGVITL
jgi:hypothetical protein